LERPSSIVYRAERCSAKRLLRAFSQPERRSLKTFLDEILGPDYSDEDIELVWSKIPGYDAFTDRCFISSGTRACFRRSARSLNRQPTSPGGRGRAAGAVRVRDRGLSG